MDTSLSVVTVLRPAAFPLTGPDANDRATAALATAVTLTLSLVAATYDQSVLPADAQFVVARGVVGMTVFALVVSSLWWGPRIFLPVDATTDRVRLKTGIVRAGIVAVAGLMLSALSMGAGILDRPGILRLGVSYVLSLLMLTAGLNLVLYLLAYPFRLISTPG